MKLNFMANSAHSSAPTSSVVLTVLGPLVDILQHRCRAYRRTCIRLVLGTRYQVGEKPASFSSAGSEVSTAKSHATSKYHVTKSGTVLIPCERHPTRVFYTSYEAYISGLN
jgi:hypothetical protein